MHLQAQFLFYHHDILGTLLKFGTRKFRNRKAVKDGEYLRVKAVIAVSLVCIPLSWMNSKVSCIFLPGVFSNSSATQNRVNPDFLAPAADTCSQYSGSERNFDGNNPISSLVSPGSGWVWEQFSVYSCGDAWLGKLQPLDDDACLACEQQEFNCLSHSCPTK